MILNFIEARNGNGLDGVVGHAGNAGESSGSDLTVFNGFFNFLDLSGADVNEPLRGGVITHKACKARKLSACHFRDGTKIKVKETGCPKDNRLTFNLTGTSSRRISRCETTVRVLQTETGKRSSERAIFDGDGFLGNSLKRRDVERAAIDFSRTGVLHIEDREGDVGVIGLEFTSLNLHGVEGLIGLLNGERTTRSIDDVVRNFSAGSSDLAFEGDRVGDLESVLGCRSRCVCRIKNCVKRSLEFASSIDRRLGNIIDLSRCRGRIQRSRKNAVNFNSGGFDGASWDFCGRSGCCDFRQVRQRTANIDLAFAIRSSDRTLILERSAFSNDERCVFLAGSQSDLSAGSVCAFAREGEFFTVCEGHFTLIGELADRELTGVEREGVGSCRVLNNREGRGFNSILGLVRQSEGSIALCTARSAANGNVTEGDGSILLLPSCPSRVHHRETSSRLISDGSGRSLQGAVDGSSGIFNRESLDVNSAAVFDGVRAGSRSRDDDLIGFLGRIRIRNANTELQRISSDIAANGISFGFDEEAAGGSGVVGVEVNCLRICESQVARIGDRDLFPNCHTLRTGNLHRAGIGDRTLVELNGLSCRNIKPNVSGIVEIVSRTGVGGTGFFVVADSASSNAEFEILAGDRSGTGHLIGSGAGAFDGTGLERAFLDREVFRTFADRHVAGRATSRSIEDVEVQVQLGEGAFFKVVVRNQGTCAGRSNRVQSDCAAGGLAVRGIISLNDRISRCTRKNQYAAIQVHSRTRIERVTGCGESLIRIVGCRVSRTSNRAGRSVDSGAVFRSHSQRIAGIEGDVRECLRSSRSHACAERERSDSGGDNGLCTLSLDARCGFVNHHQRTTCFREDHLEITIHSFTPRIMRFFLRRRLHVVNRTSARSTDGSVGMDVSTSWGGG